MIELSIEINTIDLAINVIYAKSEKSNNAISTSLLLSLFTFKCNVNRYTGEVAPVLIQL